MHGTEQEPAAPLVFDIARGSVEDGPGMRTVAFFKGCPLRCCWCHNPESHEIAPEIAYYPDRCRRCGACRDICPNRAIDIEQEQIIIRERCDACGRCADICDSLALRQAGRRYGARELAEIIIRDKTFYEVSGGGATFSGGEPLMHIDYLAHLAGLLKKEGVHIAVETSGHFNYSRFKQKLLPLVDLVLYDVKIIDPGTHEKLTGKDNRLILRNLERLAGERIDLTVRVPLAPGCTDGKENLLGIAAFTGALGIEKFQLLGYNPSGASKRENLGKPASELAAEKPLSLAEEKALHEMFRNENRRCWGLSGGAGQVSMRISVKDKLRQLS